MTSTFPRRIVQKFANEEDASPCGIVLPMNNLTSVESVFHGASCKDAKHAKLEENRKLILFAPWSLDAKDFCETVLLNLLLDYGIGKKITRAKAQRVPSAKK